MADALLTSIFVAGESSNLKHCVPPAERTRIIRISCVSTRRSIARDLDANPET